jgi:hypothetical protein
MLFDFMYWCIRHVEGFNHRWGALPVTPYRSRLRSDRPESQAKLSASPECLVYIIYRAIRGACAACALPAVSRGAASDL